MTPSKEVQNIIEGVYVFLFHTLKGEKLSDSTDAIRRNLLTQIKKFAQVSQSIRINLENDEKSLLEQPHDCHNINLNNGLYRLSTSSGSTNYSNGFSGDDTSPQTIIEDTSSTEENDDFYEEFEENNEFSSLQNSSNREIGNYKSENFSNDTKSIEDSYSIVKNVPFRNLIARCDYHGIIHKKIKNFLKSSRYFGVIADGFLYLYHKENDDKPKRVIDLDEYKVGCNSSEDNKRKKEFCFQLVSPGRKTHTFTLMTVRDRDHWVDTLNCAVCTRNSCTFKTDKNTSLGAELSIHNFHCRSTEYITDQIDGELYEEVIDNGQPYRGFENSPYNRLSSSIIDNDGQHKYYEVPMEGNDLDINSHYLPPTETVPTKIKPARPPLPDILRQKMDQSRPLPPEPANRSSTDNSYDPSIYWEIEHDSSFEKEDEQSALLSTLHERSLSQEIFDTIKERVPMLPEDCQVQISKHSKHTLLRTDMEYEIPSDVNLCIKEHYNGLADQYPNDFGNHCLYQIPNSLIVDDIYQIPPAPVPVLTPTECEDAIPLSEEQQKNLVHEALQLLKIPNDNTKVEKVKYSLDNNIGKENESIDTNDIRETPLSSVKELIKKLNDQQNRTEEKNNLQLRNSARKIYPGKATIEEKCFQYECNSNSVSQYEKDHFTIGEKDVITISIERAGLSSSSILEAKTGLFIAKFAYVGENPNELSFNRGDGIVVVDTSQNIWWEGELRGKKGVVHRDYLRKAD